MSSTAHLPFSTFALTSPSDTTPSPSSTKFTLHPSPSFPTDIWRKPANPPTAPVTSFNAPIIYKRLPLSAFSRARITVSAEFKTLYDQGGLVLVINPEAGPGKSQWVKTGIEWYQGKAFVSTVCCDKFADWSLSSSGIKTTASTPPDPSSSAGEEASVTLEIEKDPKGGALWIYVVDGEERLPVREVTWVLDVDAETECWVGVYAATPIMEGRGEGDAGGLVVGFEGWVLETK